MSILRIPFGVFVALAAIALGLLVLAAATLLMTSIGLRVGLRALDQALPGALTIGAIDGRLATGLALDDVAYTSADLDVELRRLIVEPAFAELRHGRLVLARLVASGGVVRLAADTEPEPEPLAAPDLPALPRALVVDELRIENVAIEGAGADVVIHDVAGRLAARRAAFDTIDLAIAGARTSLTAELVVGDDARGSISGAVSLPAAAADTAAARERASSEQSLRFATRFALVTSTEPWYVRLEWDEWVWTGSPAGRLRSGAGNLTVRPGTDPMRISVAVQLDAEALPDTATITALADLDDDMLRLEQLAVETLGGTITARGSASLDGQNADLSVGYSGLDPGYVDERLDGALRGTVDVAVASTPRRVAVTAAGGGTLGGRPLDVQLRATIADETLEIERASATLDDGRLEASGVVSADSTDLRLTAHVPEIASWYPPVTGAFDAAGTVVGETSDPAVDVEIIGDDLDWEALPAPPFDTLRVAIDGTLENHTVEVRAESALGGVALGVAQGWIGQTLRGTLRRATLDIARAGSWRLVAPADYVASAERFSIERVCYAGPESARVCAAADSASLELDAQDVPNALLAPWLPADVRVAGAADVAVELDWRGPPTGSLALRQPALSLTAPGAAATVGGTRVTIGDIALDATLTEQRLDAELAAIWSGTGDAIEGALTLSPPAADGRLMGRLDAALTDLTAIDALVEGIDALDGRIDANVIIAGSPDEPQVRGELRVSALEAVLPPLGIQVSNGAFRAATERERRVAFTADLCSDGCVHVTGDLETSVPERAWQLEALIEGNDFELADLPDFHAVVSPDLRLRASPELLRATGMVAFEEGHAIVDDVPRTAIRPAGETIVHGRAAADEGEATSIPVALDLEAQLGNVRFAGLGIEAELDGRLDLSQEPESALRVQGTTTVEQGTFRAYGQTLEIDGGQLIFTGAPDNPALDIRATREVDGALVGLRLTGTARSPRSVVFSEPALSESEALARLLTGRSLENAGAAADPEALERAALGLGLRRALPTLDRLGANLGLDELGVAAPGDAEGALVAGKRLGEDVYLRYKHGLFDDFAGLELIYRITDRFRLRTETGTAQSIDLIYEVDAGEAPSDDETFAPDDVGVSADSGAAPSPAAVAD